VCVVYACGVCVCCVCVVCVCVCVLYMRKMCIPSELLSVWSETSDSCPHSSASLMGNTYHRQQYLGLENLHEHLFGEVLVSN
jgi:hypothetical protein